MQLPNKKVIILWHNGGRLANQLWLFASVYAYCLEKGYKLENHCFFEYAESFNISSNNRLIDWLYFKPFVWAKKYLPKRLFANQHDYFFRWYYKVYAKTICFFYNDKIIYADHDESARVHYLKPTKNSDSRLDEFERGGEKRVYLYGWLFRNPVGIEKYRARIVEFFKPEASLAGRVEKFMVDLKNKFGTVVGVHIRQGDYKKEFHGGSLYFNEDEVASILLQYLSHNELSKGDVCFMICSDGPVNMEKLKDLNVIKTDFGATEDLYALSKTSTIIGSDSTFGVFASYYGDIPLIIFKKDGIDWSYYADKKRYFENKYSLFYDID